MSSIAKGAIVIDGSVAIAISARETGREPMAVAELERYSASGHDFYAPGVIAAETLYVLCGKLQLGQLTETEHAQAVVDFQALMANILPPPRGEASIVLRAEAMRVGYGCSRSADGLYIAVAEELTLSVPTVILTFDADMYKQAARHAPTVIVQLIPQS